MWRFQWILYFFFTLLTSSFIYDYSYAPTTVVTTETNTLTNGVFNSAERIWTPYYDTRRFNASTSSNIDVDIYYLSSLYGTSRFNIKQTSGTATCNMWRSSISSNNTTDVPDGSLISAGQIITAGSDITLDVNYPYLYIKCTDTLASTYSFELTPPAVSSSAYDSTSSLPLFMLLCAGSEQACVDSCLDGDDW